MLSYHSNYFQVEVVLNMSEVPIELSLPPPMREWGGGGGDCSIDPNILYPLGSFVVLP